MVQLLGMNFFKKLEVENFIWSDNLVDSTGLIRGLIAYTDCLLLLVSKDI